MSTCFDTHCHLQDPLLLPVLPRVLERARAAGVTDLVCCATREEDWSQVLTLARDHPGVHPMVGLHPWCVHTAAPGWLERLEGLLKAHPAGLGECGLDFRPDQPERPLQEQAFAAQVRLAIALDRPLSIHCVRAWDGLVAILEATGIPRAGAVVHAYSGSRELVPALVRLGLHLSFAASAANPAAKRAHAALAAVPSERLLFETDAPALAPPGWEGPNEPAAIVRIAQAAAQVRGDARVAERAYANAAALFGGISP